MITNIKKVYSILDGKGKIGIGFICLILILIAILETIGIALVFPLLSVIFENSTANEYIMNFFQSNFSITDKDHILKILLGLFCITVISKNIILVFSVWAKQHFILRLQGKLSKNLLEVYLDKPMSYHTNVNSSVLVRNLISEIKILVKSFILSLINIFSEIVFLFTILILLSINDYKVSIILASILLLISFSILMFHKRRLGKLGETRLKSTTSIFKILKESFDSVKEIKTRFLKDNIINNYFKFFMRAGKMGNLASVYGSLPRSIFEIIVVLCLTFFLLFNIKDDSDITKYLPTIIFYMAAAYRIIPSSNRMINNIQSIRYSEPSFKKVDDDLIKYESEKLKKEGDLNQKINFKNEINFENVSFEYEINKKILNSVSFKIKENSLVLISGSSGSGKSTLLDIILGLSKKSSGTIKVDNAEYDPFQNFEQWVKNISYVPQSIYIYDDSIEKNITLLDDKKFINYDLLEKAIRIAKLGDFINDKREGLKTFLGELGERVSGGQRQRIGIARGVYGDAKILIFDESTNALDANTEKEILINLDKLKSDKTIIFASHSTKILKELSDQIFNIKNGNVEINK